MRGWFFFRIQVVIQPKLVMAAYLVLRAISKWGEQYLKYYHKLF